jgi:hypothetical protein
MMVLGQPLGADLPCKVEFERSPVVQALRMDSQNEMLAVGEPHAGTLSPWVTGVVEAKLVCLQPCCWLPCVAHTLEIQNWK